MDPVATAKRLALFGHRAPCSDAERRAALWLSRGLRRHGRDVDMEPLWVRPQWEWVAALHCALAVVGSLLAVGQPAVGLGVLAVALVSSALDVTGRFPVLRLLWPRRATQNVVSSWTGEPRPLRLVITANVDSGRHGLAHAATARRVRALARRSTTGRAPGPRGLMVLAIAVLTGIAGARLGGVDATWLSAVQMVPTVALLFGIALLLDIALSDPTPGANDDASGVAVALALAEELDANPPSRLEVDLLFAGAGEGTPLGVRDFIRSERREKIPQESLIVLALAPCGRGRPAWWLSDGPLLPLRYHPRMLDICERVAREESHLRARPHRGRGITAAHAARALRYPGITIGCLDEDGGAPGARRPSDTADRLDAKAMAATIEFCLAVVAELDADLAERTPAAGRGDSATAPVATGA